MPLPGSKRSKPQLPSAVELDFAVPTVVDQRALDVLKRLPPRAVAHTVDRLKSWIASHPQVQGVSVRAITDPEAPDWTEVVFELVASTDVPATLALWSDVAAHLDAIRHLLHPAEATLLNRHIAVHFVTPEELTGRAPL
jgi:hypothetical protein